jgi:hypothetical protein
VLGGVVSWRGRSRCGGARQGSGSSKGRRPRCFSPKEEEDSCGQVGRLGRASYEASGPGWWARWLGPAGWGLWPGRLIWAERRWQIFSEYAFVKGRRFSRNTVSRMGGGNRVGRHRRAVGWAKTACGAGRGAEAQWGEGERSVEKEQVGCGWAGWPLGRLGQK